MEVRDYLARIARPLPKAPTSDALRDLHVAHLRAVPFENLDIHLGIPIVLEPDRILKKIVADHRGGFCYELNTAFAWLLTELGYDVTLLAAEVARPEGGYGIPFDHMTLLVAIEGQRWLSDVGFGDSFLHPLRLVEGAVHDEPEYSFRLVRREPYWHLERAHRDGGAHGTQYRFTTAPRRLEDFRDASEYHQTSPLSTFTQKVVATRALDDGRVTVTKDRILLRRGASRIETPLGGEADFREALARHLGLELP